jgi:hypothetical protein
MVKRASVAPLAGILVVACVVRLALSLMARDIIDVHNYERVADTILSEGPLSLYVSTTGIYPYPPLWVWFEVLARLLSSTGFLSFSLAIRLPIIIADVGVVWLIWHWWFQHSAHTAARLSLVYALNPVSLLITCLHGQFDAIPTFFAMLAVFYLIKRNSMFASAFALSLAVAFKSYHILLLLPVILRLESRQKQVAYTAITLVPVAIVLMPFLLNSPEAVFRELFGYKGAALLGVMVPIRTIYVPLAGGRFPADWTAGIISISRFLFLIGYGAGVWWMRKRGTLISVIVAVFTLFYAIYAGISPQYLVWVVPFLLLGHPVRLTSAIIYLGTATGGLLGFYAYAIPGLFPFAFSLPLRISQAMYGLFGTVWWMVCVALVIQIVISTREAGHDRMVDGQW